MSSGGKKKKSTSTSTQTIEPPSYIRDDLVAISDAAADLYEQGYPEYYDGQVIADFTPQQQQAIALTTDRALEGSPLVDGAQNFATDLVSGVYQDNPYLNDMIDLLGKQANQRVNQSFNASGRMGSGANADTAARAITEAQLPFLLNQYNTGIEQRLAGANIAPMLAREDYYDMSKLAAAGEAQQGQNQRYLDEDLREYMYNVQAPYNALNDYANIIYASPANQHTTTNATTTNTQSGGSGLGTALGIASLAAAPFTGGMSLGMGGLGGLGGFSSLLGAGAFGAATGGQTGFGMLANAGRAALGAYGPGF